MEATANQFYHLILADIAMAAAIGVHAPGTLPAVSGEPGTLRDAWLASGNDAGLRQKVTAMANAGLGALQVASGDAILAAARKVGVPLTEETANRIAAFFKDRRDAVLRYRR
jgi:hypothetical protein